MMATCKDCVHYELCKYNAYQEAKRLGIDKETYISIDNNVTCRFFRENTDLVEVVGCEDCKYYKQNPYSPDEDMMCMCWCDWLPTDPDDFCSYGERKTD